MREQFKDFFYFSRGEKNGIIVLLALLVILIAYPYIAETVSDSKPSINKELKKELELFTQSLQKTEEPSNNNRLNQYIIERYDSLKLFHFNPNTTSKENYKKLGLTEKQIKTINNYLSKGGKFYVKDDFRKIYGIRHQQYQILKPYILLPDKEYYNYGKKELAINEKVLGADSLFVFDPNDASPKELKKLGFSDKQATIIKNYLNKGGSFQSKEDLKKIYGISIEQYDKLEPYIFIKSHENEITPKVKKEIVELNSATISQLTAIKGIGEYSAKAIIRYRERIGGFVHLNQLLEIKSISNDRLNGFKDQLKITPSKIKKISLNFSEVEDFVAHPYLNYQQATEIVKFRSKNGPYQNIKQLLDNKILLKGSYGKIKPYLNLN
jgi:competence protein ComEA